MRSQTDRRPLPRSDSRRDEILDALDRCLQESTFDAIGIAEICRRVGVTRSAFYFYFENKAAAVGALIERLMDDAFMVNDMFTMGAGSPQNQIYTMLDGLFDTWDRHRHLFRALLEARARSASVRDVWDGARGSLAESVAGMIRADRAAGIAPDGVDAAVLAAVLLEFNDRLLERLTLGGSLTRKQLMDGAAAVWLATVYGINSTSS